jgi:Integrase core domain
MPLSASSVWNVLHRHGIEPAPRRASVSWREFLRQQAAAMVECDFFTVETLWLRRFYVLFLIELSRRRVYLAGITANPDGAWVVQQARNLTMTLADQKQRHRFLIRDRDSKFTAAFDEVFRSEGLRVIKAPIAAPRAKAHAERWVGSVRRECLDRILIVSRRQLERVPREYVTHYNTHRPHRSLEQQPPPSQADSHPCPRWRAASPPARPTRRSAPRIPTRCLGPVAISNRQPLGLRQRVPEAPAPRSGPRLDRSTRREMIPQNRLSKTEPNKVEANRVSGTDTLPPRSPPQLAARIIPR